MAYYRVHDSVYEEVRKDTFHCIASTSRRTIDSWIFAPDYRRFKQHDSKESALASLKADAYWDNVQVFTI